jgi:simple sugar transport system permease protein
MRMLRLEARPVPSQAMALASPVIALLLTAAVAALILIAIGKDPVSGLQVIFLEPLSNRRQISEVRSAWRCATGPMSGTSVRKGSS